MDYRQGNLRLFFYIVAVVLLLGGCAPLARRPMRVCPGAGTAEEALSVLRMRLEGVVPIKATGQCRLQYYAEGKSHKENFLVKLWANPPAEIYLQGDVGFNAKGIVLGSNEREFWLSIKPKEVNSYWWGQWSKQGGPGELMVSPKVVLEALGVADVGSGEGLSLSKEGGFDVLTKRNDQDVVIKKVYIDSYDYLIRRIEYFDAGRAVVVAELDKYRGVVKRFFVPGVIKIINHPAGSGEYSISFALRLESIKPTSFTERQRNRLFIRPEPRRFKHIYKIVDGDVIEQLQK